MKRLLVTLQVLFISISAFGQSVYMHEAQEESEGTNPIDVLVGFGVLYLIVYIISKVFLGKRDNSNNRTEDYSSNDSYFDEEERWDEIDRRELERFSYDDDPESVAYNSHDMSPIYENPPAPVTNPLDEIIEEENKKIYPEGSIEQLLVGVEKEGYVDLGLSVKWNSCNIGAKDIKDIGIRFRWGEINGIENYDIKKIVEYSKIPYSTDIAKYQNDISGNSNYDAAFTYTNGEGRLPTKSECEELVNECSWRFIEAGEYKGYIITGSTGKSIYLPLYFSSFLNCMYKAMLSIAVSYHTGTPIVDLETNLEDLCSNSLHMINKNHDTSEIEVGMCETFKRCHYPIRAVSN
jgi:hypothetical protein